LDSILRIFRKIIFKKHLLCDCETRSESCGNFLSVFKQHTIFVYGLFQDLFVCAAPFSKYHYL
jgi:hypothetical protein